MNGYGEQMEEGGKVISRDRGRNPWRLLEVLEVLRASDSESLIVIYSDFFSGKMAGTMRMTVKQVQRIDYLFFFHDTWK